MTHRRNGGDGWRDVQVSRIVCGNWFSDCAVVVARRRRLTRTDAPGLISIPTTIALFFLFFLAATWELRVRNRRSDLWCHRRSTVWNDSWGPVDSATWNDTSATAPDVCPVAFATVTSITAEQSPQAATEGPTGPLTASSIRRSALVKHSAGTTSVTASCGSSSTTGIATRSRSNHLATAGIVRRCTASISAEQSEALEGTHSMTKSAEETAPATTRSFFTAVIATAVVIHWGTGRATSTT